MTEPATEPTDPRTITRPAPHPSGGTQDDTQSPFHSNTMNVTILTATILIGKRETPLTKAIINQFPILEGKWADNDKFKRDGQCAVLGEVELDNGKNEARSQWLLVNTPDGVRRMDNYFKKALDPILHREGLPRIERIIITR